MTDQPTTGPFDWLEPHESDAWFGLLAIVRLGFPEIARQLRDEHEMTPVHYHILASLHSATDHTLQLTELARSAALSQSRLTQRLGILTDRGDVEINPDPNDRRAKRATLTRRGRARLNHVAPSHGETVRRVIFDHLTADQAAALGQALKPVAEALAEHPEYLDPNN